MTAGNQGDQHVFDELPALLTGELNRADTGRVSDHLRGCDDCRQELVLAVSASAALRSAIRFAPQAVDNPDDELPDPALFLAELAAGGAGNQPLADPRGSGRRPGPRASSRSPASCSPVSYSPVSCTPARCSCPAPARSGTGVAAVPGTRATPGRRGRGPGGRWWPRRCCWW
jgi:anti-sigma factor RsiW